MRRQYNVHQAKSQLSKLLEEVEAGEQVVIARNGRPVAELVPLPAESSTSRPRGGWRGRLDMSRFDAGDAEIAREFGVE